MIRGQKLGQGKDINHYLTCIFFTEDCVTKIPSLFSLSIDFFSMTDFNDNDDENSVID
jgi:hypothetical protein